MVAADLYGRPGWKLTHSLSNFLSAVLALTKVSFHTYCKIHSARYTAVAPTSSRGRLVVVLLSWGLTAGWHYQRCHIGLPQVMRLRWSLSSSPSKSGVGSSFSSFTNRSLSAQKNPRSDTPDQTSCTGGEGFRIWGLGFRLVPAMAEHAPLQS